MYDVLSLIAQLALFCAAILWVGKHPTGVKVTVMILIVAIVQLGFDSYTALSQGMDIHTWYLQTLQSVIQDSSSFSGVSASQMTLIEAMVPTVADCVIALYVVSSAVFVFGSLCLVWVYNRITHHTDRWTAFSQVDLSIWSVVLLILGLLFFAVSYIEVLPMHEILFVISLNILVVSLIPLFIQGAAAAKGILNRFGLGAFAQTLVVLLLLLLGVLFIVLPVVGLFDYWANFRKLPRSDLQE